MFELRLLLVKGENGAFTLRFSRILRGLFLGIAAVLVAAMAMSGGVSVPGLVLALISLAGGLFKERWVWNPTSGTLTHFSGLWPIIKRQVYIAEQIMSLELRRFARGRPANQGQAAKKSRFAPRMIGLSFEDREHGLVTIETHRQRDMDDLALAATLLEEALGLSLEKIEA